MEEVCWDGEASVWFLLKKREALSLLPSLCNVLRVEGP